MARTPKAPPANLAALTGEVAVVVTTREIPAEVKTFIDNAIAEYETHNDYLRLPKEEGQQIPAAVIDTAVDYGRDYARGEGYKLLTRGYKKGQTTRLTYRVKLFDEAGEDED